MLTIAERAAAITASRADFDLLFMQMQIEVGLPSGQRESFKVIAPSADDKTAFEQALSYVQQKGWLEILIDLIVASGLEDGRIAADLGATPGTPLHATIDVSRGYMLPQLVTRGVNQGARWTGKIEIDGQPRGTGILVANNRLMTAWHVVAELYDRDPNGKYEANPNGGGKIEVVFTDFMDYIGRGNQLRGRGERRVQAHKDWSVCFSNCHQDELNEQLPANPLDLDGYWDYAIIRLAEPIGLERGWLILDEKAFVPRATQKMWLFQHPRGQSARLDFEEIADLNPPQRTVIPRLRFLHKVNGEKGSSGGPCFDKTLTCFGFHQGVWSGSNPITNRGVPLTGVLEHIKKNYGTGKLEPEDSLLWTLGPDKKYAPVIGADLLQNYILNSSIHGTPRIFTIRGSKGLGKTFSANLAAALLPNTTHLKVDLSAHAIADKDAAKLADMISTAAGAGTLQLQTVSEIRSTDTVWVKDEVTVRLIEALERARNNRMVWICIKDLNAYELQNPEGTTLLSLLYEQVKTSSWLRFVLDGMQADIPGGLSEYEYRHRVAELTRDQIETYLRRFATFLDFEAGALIRAESKRLYDVYDRELNRNAENAVQILAKEIMETTAPIWKSISQGA